ncbi:hypothetical protein OPV22_007548 [Ensete ventricosum]|uniref:Uncharacterized protein n=1 Tax=Ensete ventricosum TaxID=4639 RepID=A0AAV8QEM5_ENSVE|nr:hypothetical protein OPV22_007548 [Ensete ventricosum]
MVICDCHQWCKEVLVHVHEITGQGKQKHCAPSLDVIRFSSYEKEGRKEGECFGGPAMEYSSESLQHHWGLVQP